jgi:IclR family transcriptional regulator, pca regulon regulatory protein
LTKINAVSEKDFLKTLATGLELINSFDGIAQMTLSEVAAANDLSRAVARRHLLTLMHLGYIEKRLDKFRLTPKILDIGHSYISSLDYASVLTPLMNDLSQKLTRPCSAAVLDGNEIVYIQHLGRSEFISINLTVGSRLPAYATSIGRLLLGGLSDDDLDSFLEKESFPALTRFTLTDKEGLKQAILETRDLGYCIVDQELELGLRSLAVPIQGSSGNMLLGLSISRFNEDVSPEVSTSRNLPVMLDIAKKMSAAVNRVGKP